MSRLESVSANPISEASIASGELLYDAIEKGDLKAVESALKQGSNPDFADYKSASIKSKEDKRIKENEQNDDEKQTIVVDAEDLTDVINSLIAKGSFDNYNHIAHAINAHEHGDKAYEITKRLIRSGARADALLTNGSSPLHGAIDHEDPRIMELLLAKGANPNFIYNGETPLSLAVELEYPNPAIKALVKAGANINHTDEEGNTLLHDAVVNQDRKRVDLLLKNGANPNIINNDGDTPLLFASYDDDVSYPVIEALVSHGAYVHQTNKYGKTALDMLLVPTNAKAVQLLHAVGAKASPDREDLLQANLKYTNNPDITKPQHDLKAKATKASDIDNTDTMSFVGKIKKEREQQQANPALNLVG